jgi:glucose/arabinose dehydrogenase
MKIFAIISMLSFSLHSWAVPLEKQQILQQLHLPVGFEITLFADDVPNARSLALGDNGVIYVGTRQQGSVYALQDSDGDGVADRRFELAKDLYMPNGVAYRNNQLFVATTDRILRFDDISEHLENPPEPIVIFDQLPSDKHHGWKYLRFGPDGKLYTAVGAPCNICQPEKSIYATLVRLNDDGSQFEILASGIRNTVGFDWQPGTGDLYFTDNGRDYLGDDLPPDELNRWHSRGQHFGYPFCHGGNVVDPELSGNRQCNEFVAPEWRFKAHIAPLGVQFYTGNRFPSRFKNQLFVAQHGSWNRSKPLGYRVALIKFNNDKPIKEQSFISGWLTKDDKVLGRPTDILQMPDGSLLITDDTLGVIYRVDYTK